MPTEWKLSVSPRDVAQITESVFEAMLSLQVEESGLPWFPARDRLTASVHLTGDWNGTVLLECSRQTACAFAGRFLSMESPPETVDDVVRDVLGELANMVGGNVKCAMPVGGIRLSMPAVVDGAEYSLRVCGAGVLNQLGLRCTEGDFWVTLLSTQN